MNGTCENRDDIKIELLAIVEKSENPKESIRTGNTVLRVRSSPVAQYCGLASLLPTTYSIFPR